MLRIKVFTLNFDPVLKKIDDKSFQEFIVDKQVISVPVERPHAPLFPVDRQRYHKSSFCRKSARYNCTLRDAPRDRGNLPDRFFFLSVPEYEKFDRVLAGIFQNSTRLPVSAARFQG